MKTKILAILIAGANFASAELSPEEFNQLRSSAINSGAHFVGTSQIGDRWLYRFDNASNEPIAFVPMEVGNFEQASAAFLASMGTMILCKQQWEKALDTLVQREIPLPPPGFTLDVWTE